METSKEIKRLEKTGCIKISLSELEERLSLLKFEIEKNNSFYYFNTSNEFNYNAYSCYIIDKKTKLSFANLNFGITNEEKERRKKLQEFRRYYFAVKTIKNKLIILEI